MAIKISNTTVINDSRGLENISNLKTVNGNSILGTGDITVSGGISFTRVTTATTLVDKQGIIADTSGGVFTVTLPATPATGAQVAIADGAAWGTNNLTVARNGSTIEGLAEDLVLDITGVLVNLIYDGTTWEVYSQIGAGGGSLVTLTGTETLTNKTISGASNTITNVSLTTGVTGTLPVANGGTGATTLTANNVLLGNGTSAPLTVAPSTSGNLLTSNGTTWQSTAPSLTLAGDNTWTGTQTFSGTSSKLGVILSDAGEVCTVSATAATGTINYDITTQSVLYYTTNASANWTTNFRASSGTSLNTALATGQSVTVAFLVTQGATAYYNNVVQVDGTATGVTTRWIGGAPTAGNASGIDSYRYVIIKTAAATFTVLASINQFKA